MPPAPADKPSLLEGYQPPAFDEAIQADGRPRPSHAAVLEALLAMSPASLRERESVLEREKVTAGVVFRPTDQKIASPFPVDFVPRILSSQDWSALQAGTEQRARALDAFVADVYGEGAVIRDGIVPAALVTGSPGYRAAGKAPPAGRRRIQVSGFDIVRDREGRWLVLEDNVRVPSGVAYAIENRRLMRRAFPELVRLADLLDAEQAPQLLRRTLEESAPLEASKGDPTIVLLGSGPDDSAYFEHRMLADAMGVPALVAADLRVEDDVVWCVKDRARQRVDVVYLRMDDQLEERLDADGQPLGPRLVAAVRAGTVSLANALGNGVADDKAVYAYVPKLVEYYLGERPMLEQVRTYHCADPEQKAEVLARLDQLVSKPIDGYGGLGVLIGPRASERELTDARAVIEKDPARWIAQEMVSLSTHPTFDPDAGKLVPRHIDLRVFVYYGTSPVVVPAALTRVAPAGSMVVNSSRGGGAKDTWLLR